MYIFFIIKYDINILSINLKKFYTKNKQKKNHKVFFIYKNIQKYTKNPYIQIETTNLIESDPNDKSHKLCPRILSHYGCEWMIMANNNKYIFLHFQLNKE